MQSSPAPTQAFLAAVAAAAILSGPVTGPIAVAAIGGAPLS